MQITIQHIKKELEGVYPVTEIEGLIRIILEWATGWNYTFQQINRQTHLDEPVRQKIFPVLLRLKKFEPIQYILGETEFFGVKIKVSPAVLIPRQETEELVKWILDRNNYSETQILDIGTGSGCIALALKKHLMEAQVHGIDVSEPALEIAKENAKLNQLKIRFDKVDILHWEENKWNNYDIIVSNPPYVRESEKRQMQRNVLDFEPETALFVSNTDPLIFYRKIADFANAHLKPNGFLFFEINENFGNEMVELLNSFGFKNIEVANDINGKKRMIYGSK